MINAQGLPCSIDHFDGETVPKTGGLFFFLVKMVIRQVPLDFFQVSVIDVQQA